MEPPQAILNGFTVRNGGNADPNSCGGIAISNASPTVTNNIVTANQNCGISVDNYASPSILANDIIGNIGRGVIVYTGGDVKLSHNIIEENVVPPEQSSTESFGAGVAARTDNTNVHFAAHSLVLESNVIRNNTSQTSPGFAQQISSGIRTLTLVNNLFYGNTPHSADANQVYISGPYLTSGLPVLTGLTEVNKTIVGGGQLLILSFGPSLIANNVFFNLSNAPAQSEPDFSGLSCGDPEAQNSPIDIHNNDIANVGPRIDGGCRLGRNNLSSDPLLRDPAHGDLHEQAQSPLVAAGDITAPLLPSADLDNKARTVCNTIDIGAYELRPHPPIALTSSANPTPGGGTITFAAQLTGNCNVPTGTVTFLDGGTVLGTASLNSGAVASFSTSFLVVGNHTITASYSGDFNFEQSVSPILVQVITGDPTITSLTVSPNPATAFTSITLGSTVSSQYGTPTGLVVFSAGADTLATAVLDSSGHASADVRNLGSGTYLITANYTADTRFQPSTSPAVQEVVVGAESELTLTGTPNPAIAGQQVTFTAAVRALQGATIPTGTVTFTNAGTPLGSSILTNGVATFTTTALGLGSHLIVAHYPGSPNLTPSTASLTEIINSVGTALTLTVSPDPARSGQAVSLTASAKATLGAIVPAGTVSFRDGTTILGIAAVDPNGLATFATTSLSVGAHPLQAVFSGSPLFAPSTSPVVNEVIQAYDFQITLSQDAVSIPSEDWSRITVTVTPIGAFAGDVTLSCANLPQHAQCRFEEGSTVSLANGARELPLVLSTSDVYRYGNQVSFFSRPTLPSLRWNSFLFSFAFPSLGLLTLGRRSSRMRKSLFVVSVASLLLGLQACSGQLPAGTAPGKYTISVLGLSAAEISLQHTSPLIVTVTSH